VERDKRTRRRARRILAPTRRGRTWIFCLLSRMKVVEEQASGMQSDKYIKFRYKISIILKLTRSGRRPRPRRACTVVCVGFVFCSPCMSGTSDT
jgi:hypothetical protein